MSKQKKEPSYALGHGYSKHQLPDEDSPRKIRRIVRKIEAVMRDGMMLIDSDEGETNDVQVKGPAPRSRPRPRPRRLKRLAEDVEILDADGRRHKRPKP